MGEPKPLASLSSGLLARKGAARPAMRRQPLGNGPGHDAVSQDEVMGFIANPYEDQDVAVRSPRRGIIIGRTTLPIVNMGDALFHIAWSEELGPPKSMTREKEQEMAPEPVLDEDEII